jgi:hypothetical protein
METVNSELTSEVYTMYCVMSMLDFLVEEQKATLQKQITQLREECERGGKCVGVVQFISKTLVCLA